jgi:hypothetical protein
MTWRDILVLSILSLWFDPALRGTHDDRVLSVRPEPVEG